MNNKIFVWLLGIIGVLIFVILVLFWRGAFSRSDVKMEIVGPSEIMAGQEVEYIVKFKNNSNASLEQMRLTVELPTHSIPSEGATRVMIKEDKDIGILYPGEEKSFKFKARIFGNEGDAKEISALLMYQPKGLKARYPSKIKFITAVKNSSMNLEFDAQSKIEAGREIKLSLNYFSNIEYPLKDLKIEVKYPGNFEFITASPTPEGTNYWPVKELNKGEGGRINITGYLGGKIGEKKEFQAKIGFTHEGEFIVLKEAVLHIGLEDPAIQINESINGTDRYIASLGERLNYEIKFRNIGVNPFRDLFAVVRLNGDLFDFSSIEASGAETDSASSTIIWDGNDLSELRVLAPGEEGIIRFSIKIKSQIPRQFLNPALIAKVIIGQTQKEFTTRINSKLDIEQSLQVNDDVFLSDGPLPLKADQESILTVFWDVKNYFNDAINVRAKATLPSNIEFVGTISPESEVDKVNFDANSREIVWQIGKLEAGTGLKDKRKVGAFQVRVKPNASDRDSYMTILKDIVITGEDDWTQKELINNIEILSSKLLGEGDGKVK